MKREARLRDVVDGTRLAGAAATARSAQSAVATITTAITCLVRRIRTRIIGQSIEMPQAAVKDSAAFVLLANFGGGSSDLDLRRAKYYFSYRELGLYVRRARSTPRYRRK